MSQKEKPADTKEKPADSKENPAASKAPESSLEGNDVPQITQGTYLTHVASIVC
jgi:hypothetical protein